MSYDLEQRAAEAIARRAGKMILEGMRQGFDVDLKGKNDLVTNVDRAIEVFCRAEFETLFPNDGFLGEEFGGQGPEGRQWVVDPIDGTLNFAQGIPMSCVSIALLDSGKVVVGVIYEPYRDELFSAQIGQGADLNGQKLNTSSTEVVADAVIATGFPPLKTTEDEDNLECFAAVTRASRGLRRLGSAALDLAYVAAGRLDAFWEFHLNPWDTLAGVLLVSEAGGAVTDERGGPYSGFENCVVATNGLIQDELLDTLQSAL